MSKKRGISPEFHQALLSRLDFVRIVRRYVPKLRKTCGRGEFFKAPCPFRAERTSSFVVNADRKIWYCFAEGRGGDAVDFLMRIEGLDFDSAIRELSDLTSMDVP